MIEVFDFEQNSEEWRRARMGIPTASEFKVILAKGGSKDAKTRRTYLFKLAGERITGEPKHEYSNNHMERGKEMEEEARNLYALISGVVPKPVGFIRSGDKGCSPDSLIDANGMLEIKTKLAHLQIECLLDDALPPEHRAQCQGQLWVAEREYCDFVSYWPGLPLFAKRIYRDEEYIKALEVAVRAFNLELDEIVAAITKKAA